MPLRTALRATTNYEQAGFIRGFLNDGSAEYKSHHSVDSLAFGHCKYAFRNLGRPSKIAVRQSKDNFRVEVDGNLCFESPKVRLPTGYQLGVTAASAENPDSFEVFKVVVTTESSTPDDAAAVGSNSAADGSTADPKAPINRAADGSIPSFTDPADEPASAIPADAQFADLHNRLQAMMKHISALNRDVVTSQAQAMERANVLQSRLDKATDQLNSLAAMDRKMGEIAADVRQTKADLHSSLDRHVAGLKSVVADTHRTVLGSIAASAPSVLGYVLVVVCSQAVTVAAYLVYKRRKNAGPKKYL
jgi:mannose-binding lectin 1